MRTSIQPPKSPSASCKFLRMGLRVMNSGSGGGVDGGSFGVTAIVSSALSSDGKVGLILTVTHCLRSLYEFAPAMIMCTGDHSS